MMQCSVKVLLAGLSVVVMTAATPASATYWWHLAGSKIACQGPDEFINSPAATYEFMTRWPALNTDNRRREGFRSGRGQLDGSCRRAKERLILSN
jgi:hypothetical protein